MICIKVEFPEEICEVDDELKAIYHSRDTVCIWLFKTRTERKRFMEETIGMMKDEKERIIMKHFSGTLQKTESNTTEECDLDSSTENPLSFH